MSIWTWFKSFFGSEPIPLAGDDINMAWNEYLELYGDYYIRELAFNAAANIVANTVSKCEFKTFFRGNETKGSEYYLWNVEPNRNQNSTAFIHKWIYQLYRRNEYLIIEQNGQLLVADSFIRTPYALYDDVFTQVTVSDFTFKRSFTQSEVLYGQLNSQDMRRVVNGLYESYSKLIAYTMKMYQKSRGLKATYEYDTLPTKGTMQEAAFNDLISTKFKEWLSADSAIVPIGKGTKINAQGIKTCSDETTRDIRAMIDDICDFTAKGFCIPPALLRGDVQGTADAVDNLLTFCADPLVDNLQEEINRKRNGRDQYLAGTYLQIDTKAVKHVDLLSVSTAIDKLIGSGAFCVNDIRRLVGEEPIDEEWANTHFITKNYMTFDEALKIAEGGGNT